MECPHCSAPIRQSEYLCPVCYKPCDYPNVRAACTPEEQKALAERLSQAEANAARCGTATVLALFREAVRSSKAVLCRPIGLVMTLVSSDSQLYASFYQLVG